MTDSMKSDPELTENLKKAIDSFSEQEIRTLLSARDPKDILLALSLADETLKEKLLCESILTPAERIVQKWSGILEELPDSYKDKNGIIKGEAIADYADAIDTFLVDDCAYYLEPEDPVPAVALAVKALEQFYAFQFDVEDFNYFDRSFYRFMKYVDENCIYGTEYDIQHYMESYEADETKPAIVREHMGYQNQRFFHRYDAVFEFLDNLQKKETDGEESETK